MFQVWAAASAAVCVGRPTGVRPGGLFRGIVLSVGAFGLAYHSGPLLEDVLLSVLGLAGFVLVPFLGDLA